MCWSIEGLPNLWLEISLGPASDWRHPLSRYVACEASWSILHMCWSIEELPNLWLEISLGPASDWRHPLSRYVAYWSILKYTCVKSWEFTKSLSGDLFRGSWLGAPIVEMWSILEHTEAYWNVLEQILHEWFFCESQYWSILKYTCVEKLWNHQVSVWRPL